MIRQNKFAHSSFGAVVGSGIRDEQNSGSGSATHWLDQKICFYDRATYLYAESTHKRKN